MNGRTKIILTSSLCLSFSLFLGACSASGPRYTPRADVPVSQYTQEHHAENAMDLEYYMQYEHREPCQNYREPPRNMMVVNCHLVPIPAPPIVVASQTVVQETQTTQTQLLPIVTTYTINFDFDRSAIRSGENATLDLVAQEINKYNPTQITVTGHTDTSGSAEYNQGLSKKRADSVVYALSQRGINSQVVDETARGEYDLAVETADGVKLEENRRVVIDFRR